MRITGPGLDSVLRVLPYGALSKIEHRVRLAQGKGPVPGGVAREVVEVLAVLTEERSSAPVVFDIGANVGDWTAALIDRVPAARVWCFEPSAAAVDRLRTRFRSCESDVTVVPTALGSIEGSVDLWADAAGSTLGSLTRRRVDHHGIRFGHSEKVSVTTLDRWVSETGIVPDVVKMDVEGHELDVIRSGRIALDAAAVVQFEFGGANIDTRTYWQDFWYLSDSMGFRIARITPRGLFEVERYREQDECFVMTNYVAWRRAEGRTASPPAGASR